MPSVLHVAGGGQKFTAGDAIHDERTLDVGIATAVNPRSKIILYAGSGHQNGAGSDPFTAYQSAVWDTVNKPEVLSSSFSSYQHIAPGSPFHFAQEQRVETSFIIPGRCHSLALHDGQAVAESPAPPRHAIPPSNRRGGGGEPP